MYIQVKPSANIIINLDHCIYFIPFYNSTNITSYFGKEIFKFVTVLLALIGVAKTSNMIRLRIHTRPLIKCTPPPPPLLLLLLVNYH